MSRSSNLFFDLSHFAMLEASGDDAADFLQNQLTCDINKLPPDEWCFCGWCLPNGRTICTFILFRRDDRFYFILPAMLKDKIMKRLGMYILRAEVTLKDVSEDFALLGLSGESIESTLKVSNITFDNNGYSVHTNADLSVLGLWNSTPRCIVICPIDRLSTLSKRIRIAFEEGDRSTWSLLDIEAGIPWITEAISEAFIPQMLNLDRMQGLSFQKGCYPGQEVISRLYFRGELKRRLYLGQGEGSITPGAGDQLEVTDSGKLAGDIVDAERHPDGGFRFLAVTQIDAAEKHSLRLRGGENNPVSLQPLHYPESHPH
ncbi:MAG TPA: folate-binding protein [Gammaproteobacteria bacterium]|nr:folate-binding protein [Gammaproteobacteria bacterium]